VQHSSAYWLAKAENASLQRVYGISFPNKEKLKEWKAFMKMAEERDHRKIGQQQELFFFHKWSPGSAFFLPHGTRVYNKLMQLIKNEYNARGYQEVITPNVFNIDLWKRSGHYDNYRDNMFTFECEKVEFGMKPMVSADIHRRTHDTSPARPIPWTQLLPAHASMAVFPLTPRRSLSLSLPSALFLHLACFADCVRLLLMDLPFFCCLLLCVELSWSLLDVRQLPAFVP